MHNFTHIFFNLLFITALNITPNTATWTISYHQFGFGRFHIECIEDAEGLQFVPIRSSRWSLNLIPKLKKPKEKFIPDKE